MLNFGTSTLVTGIAAGATSCTVQSGHGGARFRDPATEGEFNAVIWNATDYANAALAFHASPKQAKIVRVTAIVGDTLTITTNEEGTSDVALNTGGKTYQIDSAVTETNISEMVGVESVDANDAIFAKNIRIGDTDNDGTERGVIFDEGFHTWAFIAENGEIRIDATDFGVATVKAFRMIKTGEASFGRGGAAAQTGYDLLVQSPSGIDTKFGVRSNNVSERFSITMAEGGLCTIEHEGQDETLEIKTNVAGTPTTMMSFQGFSGGIRFQAPIVASGTDDALDVQDSGTADSITITKSGTAGNAIDARCTSPSSSSSCIFAQHDGSGNVVFAESTAGGTAGSFRQTNATATVPCVVVTQSGDFSGVQISQQGNGIGLDIDKSGATASSAATINDDGTGITLHVDKTANGVVAQLEQSDGAATNHVLVINNAGSGRHIDTDAGPTTSAHLTNAGVWTDGSCWEEIKEDVQPIDRVDFLRNLPHLRVNRYRAKTEVERGVDMVYTGPFQNDLVGLFGMSSEGVRPTELASIAIVGAQELLSVSKKLHDRIASLEGLVEGATVGSKDPALEDLPAPPTPAPAPAIP